MFAKNFEDAMVLYQSALRTSGQHVPPPASTEIYFDSSPPSAICSIADLPSFTQSNVDELNQTLSQLNSLRDEIMACLSTSDSPEFVWDNAATVSITKSLSAFIDGSVSLLNNPIRIGG